LVVTYDGWVEEMGLLGGVEGGVGLLVPGRGLDDGLPVPPFLSRFSD